MKYGQLADNALHDSGRTHNNVEQNMYTAVSYTHLDVYKRQEYTVVIVTHNMQQAGRIADKTAFFLLGEIVEYDDTVLMFNTPRDKRTEDYITGRFG